MSAQGVRRVGQVGDAGCVNYGMDLVPGQRGITPEELVAVYHRASSEAGDDPQRDMNEPWAVVSNENIIVRGEVEIRVFRCSSAGLCLSLLVSNIDRVFINTRGKTEAVIGDVLDAFSAQVWVAVLPLRYCLNSC